jgi:RNA polymerase sigma factor (TIGR02999 family)
MESGTDVVDIDVTKALTPSPSEPREVDPRGPAELLPLVYAQLRRLAAEHVSRERPGHTLEATALVHQAYLQLVQSGEERTFQGRWHFYAVAAGVMRRILVDEARRRGRLKRGAGLGRVDFDHLRLCTAEPSEQLVSLDEGLSLLSERHPEKAQLVTLRYFAGLTIAEAAEAIGVSVATANRHWVYARAWLYRHVVGDPSAPDPSPHDVPPAPRRSS